MNRQLWMIACVGAALLIGSSSVRAEDAPRTTIYVVRHAEKGSDASRPRDPPLSERGMARAADLRDELATAGIDAVYSTGFQRTSMTAGPTAGAAGLQTVTYQHGAMGKPGGLPNRATMLAKHAGQSVLVVGHSNTAPQIVTALGGDGGPQLAEDEYDNLFVVELRGDETRLRRHRYGTLEPTRRVQVTGEVFDTGDGGREDVSGVVITGGGVAVVCTDEGIRVQEWLPTAEGYVAQPEVSMPVSSAKIKELDLEGVAAAGGFVYAVGSHSSVRKGARQRTKKGKRETYENNRKRLGSVDRPGKDERDRLFRVPLGEDGRVQGSGIAVLDLRRLLKDEPLLRTGLGVPSKENGVDVEGLAVDSDGSLVLGLRGPVLRGNYTPILRVTTDQAFNAVTTHRVSFVELNGRGVRGLTRCATGFLVLAGPVGDMREPHRLYHWDGEDMLPGRRDDSDASKRVGVLTLLGTVPGAPGTSAEGVALLDETDAAFRVLVVFDGAPGGAPTEFVVRKIPGL